MGMTPEELEREAYYIGIDDFRDRKPRDGNRYEKGTKEFDEWEEGWLDEEYDEQLKEEEDEE